jgi:hypothetical protein
LIQVGTKTKNDSHPGFYLVGDDQCDRPCPNLIKKFTKKQSNDLTWGSFYVIYPFIIWRSLPILSNWQPQVRRFPIRTGLKHQKSLDIEFYPEKNQS